MKLRHLARFVPRTPNDAHSLAASAARLGRGLVARHQPRRLPERPIELFEFEGCPYCRKVRDALTELDLGYVSRSCGKGSATRDEAVAKGGKAQFPLLHDPNVGGGLWLYESEDVIDHLFATYGPGPRPRWQRLAAPLDLASSALASAIRPRGVHVRTRHERRVQPAQRLELWSFEASPYCRKVREELTELGLDAVIHNVGKRGRRRPELVALGGKMQVPYLVDPNTGAALYESDDIVAYLRLTYG